jgi:hypothetical protein
MMKLELVFDSTTPIADVRCDLELVKRYFSKLEQYGIPCELLDIANKSQDEIYKIYSEAIVPSVMKKVGIRRVFGSKRQSALLFGKQVPALLIYRNEEVDDVYPQFKKWAGHKELVTIEKYLEDFLKLFELSASKRHVKEAARALANNMPRYAVICCMFAIEAFIWRVLWGRKDLEVVWTDGKHRMVSSVDLVYLYCRKSKADFVNEAEFEKFKELNQKLFDKLRNPDDLLLSCAIAIGVISKSHTCLVKDIRTIRNFCSHFNPFESTIKSYKEAVQNLKKNINLP